MILLHAKKTGADQHVHTHSPIVVFAIRSLERKITVDASCNIYKSQLHRFG